MSAMVICTCAIWPGSTTGHWCSTVSNSIRHCAGSMSSAKLPFWSWTWLHQQQPNLAWRFLNAYLEHSGGYGGLRLLPFYLVYRAMVRAKIEVIRANQPGVGSKDKKEAETEIAEYLWLAEQCSQQRQPMLIITRGMSASGQSTISSLLLEVLQAVRIRSDVERKRLFGLSLTDSGQAPFNAGIYTNAAGKKTYHRLLQLAESVIEAGFPVIVDAAFLETEQRQPFQRLATRLGVPYVILEFRASPETLRDRIQKRGVTTHPYQHRAVPKRPFEWRPADCIPDLPWSAGNITRSNRACVNVEISRPSFQRQAGEPVQPISSP